MHHSLVSLRFWKLFWLSDLRWPYGLRILKTSMLVHHIDGKCLTCWGSGWSIFRHKAWHQACGFVEWQDTGIIPTNATAQSSSCSWPGVFRWEWFCHSQLEFSGLSTWQLSKIKPQSMHNCFIKRGAVLSTRHTCLPVAEYRDYRYLPPHPLCWIGD